MPRKLVNREKQGRLLAQTSGAVTMIDESHYGIRSKSSFNTLTSLQLNWVGFVHVETMFVAMPNASMYMQSNSTAIKI